jgi:hypothetical protein
MAEERSDEESRVEGRASMTVRVGRMRKESSSSENKLEVQADGEYSETCVLSFY